VTPSDLEINGPLLALLQERVSERTLRHCVGTAEYMASFTDTLEISTETLVTTGLLHDLCKGLTDDVYLARAAHYGIVPNSVQLAHPKFLHGPVAAEMCQRDLALKDPDICDAIRWHTTGRPHWTSLGLAVYLADFAEPTRTFPEADKARAIMAREGFWNALRYVADQKIKHVRTRMHVDPVSGEFYSWLGTILP